MRKAELFEGGIARGVTLAPVNTVADVLQLDHLAARDYWDDVRLPSGRVLRAPGAFVKASAEPIAWTRPAPDVGEHTREVLDALAGAAPRVRCDASGARNGFRWTGVKVADFSWIGVGPITAKALADHGATVVHVEHDRPADRLRLVGPFKDDIPGINRCHFFGAFNTSKLSLQLDLKHPAGNEVARRLLAWCDVALDSFTAGTMGELGLGYDVARELNPSIIMATTCLMGQDGPAAAARRVRLPRRRGERLLRGHRLGRPPAGGPFNAYTDTVAPRFLATVAARRARPPPADRMQGSSSTRRRWSRRSTSSPPAARRPGVRCQRPARRQRAPVAARPTTPTRAPASTSGARSPSRPTSSGRPCGRRSASRRGRWTARSTRPTVGSRGAT